MNDSILIDKIRKGDKHALGKIYDKYKKRYLSVVLSKFSNSLSSDEIVDSYTNVILDFNEKIKKYEDRGKLLNYLLIIGIRKLSELYRIQKREREKDIHVKNNYLELLNIDNSKIEDLYKKVSSVLSEIDDDCRKRLKLYYYQQYSMSEIGELMLAKTTNTADNPKNVKQKKSRCLQKLRKIFKEKYSGFI